MAGKTKASTSRRQKSIRNFDPHATDETPGTHGKDLDMSGGGARTAPPLPPHRRLVGFVFIVHHAAGDHSKTLIPGNSF